MTGFGLLCCAVPINIVLCCAVLCCAVLCCAVLCCAADTPGAAPRVQQQLPGGSGAPQAQHCGWALCVQAVWAAATAAAWLQQVAAAVQVGGKGQHGLDSVQLDAEELGRFTMATSLHRDWALATTC